MSDSLIPGSRRLKPIHCVQENVDKNFCEPIQIKEHIILTARLYFTTLVHPIRPLHTSTCLQGREFVLLQSASFLFGEMQLKSVPPTV